jgi:hypothetical protein
MTILAKDWQILATTVTETFAGTPAISARAGYWADDSIETATLSNSPTTAVEAQQPTAVTTVTDFAKDTTYINSGTIKFSNWGEIITLKVVNDILKKRVYIGGGGYWQYWEDLHTAAEIDATITPVLQDIVNGALQDSIYNEIPLGKPLRLSSSSFFTADGQYLAVWSESTGAGICTFNGFGTDIYSIPRKDFKLVSGGI